jgi:hypothetical protein
MKQTNFGELLSNLDLFGATVNFSVRGKRHFKTKLGGLLSLTFAIVSLLYGTYNAHILFNKLDTTFN